MKVSPKKVWPVTHFFAVESNLSFWWDLEQFSQKSVPSHTFLRCGDYLKFLMELGKFRQKSVISYTVFRSADCLQFLMGLRKILTKMCAQLHLFSLWRLTWVFDGTWKKKFTKKCAQSQVSSLYRLSQGFDGTWKVSTKRCDQLHIFFAVQTVFSFWWDLEKFQQKCVPSYTFFRCGDYLKFLMGLGKISTKKCAQLHVSSLWRLS